MSKRGWLCVFILTLVGILLAQPVFAEMTFKWGPYLRIRHEFWKNWNNFNNDTLTNRNYFRIKTSLWGQVNFNKDNSLYAKLTNENKTYTYFPQSTGKKGFHYQINEVVFDNLYLDLKNVISGAPIDVRLGRQDFYGMYGDGFLISDGTPSDGSRTTYFDAAKASWRINKKSSLDFLAINNKKYDLNLPIINEVKPRQQLNLSDETAYALIYKNDEIKNLHYEPYFIYKVEEGSNTNFNIGDNKLGTIGAYGKYTFGPYLLKGQFAYETGEEGTHDRNGIGGYTFLTRSFKDVKFKPTANIGYMYLSGDNPKTDKVEAWDPLFSRWPIMSDVYSELYYLTYITEGGIIGYWTNTQLAKVGLVLVPTKKSKLSLAYYYLRANYPMTGAIFGTGKNRGQLVTAKWDYAFNKNISFYTMGEIFHPGDFYGVNNRDDGLFLRSQLELKY